MNMTVARVLDILISVVWARHAVHRLGPLR
jgi:hypothetical protein